MSLFFDDVNDDAVILSIYAMASMPGLLIDFNISGVVLLLSSGVNTHTSLYI